MNPRPTNLCGQVIRAIDRREQSNRRAVADAFLRLALELDQWAAGAANKTLQDAYRKEINRAKAGFKLYFTRSTPLPLP